MTTIVLPKEVAPRWRDAIRRNHYMEWQSFAFYLRGLSRLAVADNKFSQASDLLMLSQVAYQRAVDMEPKEIAA